jgi:hypothetical protein
MIRLFTLVALTVGMIMIANADRANSDEPACQSCDCKGAIEFHSFNSNVLHLASRDKESGKLTYVTQAYHKGENTKVYAATCNVGELDPTGQKYHLWKWANAPFTRDCAIESVLAGDVLVGTANITGITATQYTAAEVNQYRCKRGDPEPDPTPGSGD